MARAEGLRTGDVHQEENGEFPFLAEAFDKGGAHAGGDIPVNGPDVVARDILADFVEFNPMSLEHGVVLAGEMLVYEPVGDQADLPHLLHQFFDVEGHGYRLVGYRLSVVGGNSQ